MWGRMTFTASAVILVGMALLALFAPWLAAYRPNEMVHAAFDPPGIGGWLGADSLGRDMYSRILYGLRYTMGVTALATVMAMAVGVSLAIAGALTKGWFDLIVGRLIDIVMSIPQIILALIILSITGISLTSLVVTIALLQASTYFRLTRPLAGDISAMEYMEVAALRGEGLVWNLRREILPNIAPALLAQFALGLSSTALFVSALSFLGVGIQPPAADLGGLVRENALAISAGDLTPLIPAFCIMLFCLSVSGIVDWLIGRFSDRPGVA